MGGCLGSDLSGCLDTHPFRHGISYHDDDSGFAVRMFRF